MRLRDVMSVEVITVGADDPANVARATMRQHRIRHLVVVEDGRLVGIVSERDLGGTRGAASGSDRPVRDLMAADPVSASPATTLRQAANLMRGQTLGCLLVVKDGRVDSAAMRPIARGGYDEYSVVERVFSMPRPA